MRNIKVGLLLSSMLIAACGGGGGGASGGSSQGLIPPVNNSPSIGPSVSFSKATLESDDSFTLFFSVSDPESDVISGTASVNDSTAPILIYTGSENFTHQVSLTAPEAGEYIIELSISDAENSPVLASYDIEVLPNDLDMQASLSAALTGFMLGGESLGQSLLGIVTKDNSANIAYQKIGLTDEQIAFNAAPNGSCGERTPHKFLEVERSSNGITIPDDGIIFPLECITPTQTAKIQAKAQRIQKASPFSASFQASSGPSYTAQTVTVTIETTEEGEQVSSNFTGAGIILEGNIEDVYCEDFELDATNTTFLLDGNDLIQNLAVFDDSDDIAINCERGNTYNAAVEVSPLLGMIKANLVRVDSLAPTGSIDSIAFSVPFNNGGLDVGEVCAATSLADEGLTVNEVITLEDSDELTAGQTFGAKNDEGLACLPLTDLEGNFHISQLITDGAGNNTENQSDSFVVTPNQAPVFSAEIEDSLSIRRINGVITLVNANQVSDPESHEITLSGDLTIDTSEPAGIYNQTITARDEFGAISDTTIVVTLVDNLAPIASPLANAGIDMSVNTGIVVQLNGSESSDPDGDAITYVWTLESKPFGSIASLSAATTDTPTISVDRAGTYEISLTVSDGETSSSPSSIMLTVIEGVNPLAQNIDLLISGAGLRFFGFSGSDNTETLQSIRSGCQAQSLDIDSEGIVWSVSRTGIEIQKIDPSQPLCLTEGSQPENFAGLAIDEAGTFWATSSLTSDENDSQYTKLFKLNSDLSVNNEVNFNGTNDTIFGIDFAPNGTLYGVGHTQSDLVTINQTTGETTFIADLEGSPYFVQDIDIDADGILRVFNNSNGQRELNKYNIQDGSLIDSAILSSVCSNCGIYGLVTRE